MIIHSDVDKSEVDIDMDKLCLICHEEITEDDVQLKCSHKFHYKCIYMTYKALGGQRECPYCRGDGG